MYICAWPFSPPTAFARLHRTSWGDDSPILPPASFVLAGAGTAK